MHVLDRLSDEAKKEFWASLALRYSEGVRPRLLAKILRHYGSAYQAYQKLTSQEPLVVFDEFAKKSHCLFVRRSKMRVGANPPCRNGRTLKKQTVK